jgi:hypothetical protein
MAAIGMVRAARSASAAQHALAILLSSYRCWRNIMTHLLVKDLSRLDEVDRQMARSVRGGIAIITKPTEPSPWPSVPGMPSMPWPPMHLPMPPVHAGDGGGRVAIPDHGYYPIDARLQ